MGTGRSFPRVRRATSRLRFLLIFAVLAILAVYTLPRAPRPLLPPRRIQYDFADSGVAAENRERADAVKGTMKDTFWKYREAAWGMDEVRPVSGGNSTSRNGWAATLVDSLTTTLMMGLEEEFKLVGAAAAVAWPAGARLMVG